MPKYLTLPSWRTPRGGCIALGRVHSPEVHCHPQELCGVGEGPQCCALPLGQTLLHLLCTRPAATR